jgi:hypothetical protein
MKMKCLTIFMRPMKLNIVREIRKRLKTQSSLSQFRVGDNGAYAPSLEHFIHSKFGQIWRWRRYSGWPCGQCLENKLWREIYNAKL